MPVIRSITLLAFITSPALALAAPDDGVKPHAGMLQYPDISGSKITFVYANDIWTAPRTGGVASPLASPPGQELFPKFAPDGDTIAYIGNYDGNRDVYVIPAEGGVSTRLTHHPGAEVLNDWMPDGQRILFYMSGLAGLQRQSQMFIVASAGGLPAQIPLPYATVGAVSPDGEWLAYTPHTTDFRTWKRYRGGMATDIWLFNLKTYAATRMTDWEGTDTLPMWHRAVVYYLSDQGENHKLNIWSFDTRTQQRTQVTTLDEFDIKWPSIGPGPGGEGEIIFQHGPELKVLNLGDRSVRVVEIIVPGDRPAVRPRDIDASQFISAADVSPSGKRLAVETRGDLWSLPAREGVTKNLTRTSTAAERDPAWSPDGKHIAYLSDQTGEYELYLIDAEGEKPARQLTTDGAAYRYMRGWSPDSKHLVFTDKTGAIFLHTIDPASTVQIAKDTWANQSPVSWSHDSNWIAHQLTNDNQHGSIWLYDVRNNAAHRVTDPFFDAGTPAFDRAGDFLYFVGKRRFAPSYSDLDTTFIYEESDVILALPLRADVKNPFAPKDDAEESKKDEKKDAAAPAEALLGVWEGDYTGNDPANRDAKIAFTFTFTKDDTGAVKGIASAGGADSPIENITVNKEAKSFAFTIAADATYTIDGKLDGDTISGTWKASDGRAGDFAAKKNAEASKLPLKIDLEGLERRAIPLPIKPGIFPALAVADGGKVIFFRRGRLVLPDEKNPGGASLRLYDPAAEPSKREEKTILDAVNQFTLTSDGKKLLIRKSQEWAVVDAAPDQKIETKVPVNAMRTTVQPRDEWRQMFVEAWRLQRDFFYEPTMHGVDWPAMKERYLCMIDDAATRDDLSYIIRELISELNVGHAYYNGGDLEKQPTVNVGLLGCDYALENGAYRITKIHEGAPWDSDARGPLSQPGVDVKVGDYLLAVNAEPVDAFKDPWAAFQGLADQAVQLTVSEEPMFSDKARRVLVKPLASEANLRYRAWIEANRRYVAEKTGNTVGYIYVPNTGVDGQNDLIRQFFGQRAMKGLIIDERWNGGGQIPTRFIELLNRPRVNYWARRDGNDWPWPPDSHQGPKVMLINGLAGSGGDMFPALFRQMGIGKLIGTRTWGGLVGITGNPALIDGGSVTAPTFGYYQVDGTWGIEGHGVDPDIEVIDDPSKLAAGTDPQLDAAIRHVLDEIQRAPYTPPARPASPNRSGMGIAPEDK